MNQSKLTDLTVKNILFTGVSVEMQFTDSISENLTNSELESKADRALSKLNFLFPLQSKINVVTIRKCNSHLQYYEIDLSFSIKLLEINLYVCEEYKTEHVC